MKLISREKVIAGMSNDVLHYRYFEIFETSDGCRHCRLAG